MLDQERIQTETRPAAEEPGGAETSGSPVAVERSGETGAAIRALSTAPGGEIGRGLTLRSFLLSLLFGGLGCLWVAQNSLIRAGVQVGGSVPPIPALAFLALLGLITPGLKKWGLDRREILYIYIFTAVSSAICHVDVLGYFFAYLTVPVYFSVKEKLAPIVERLPDTWIPKDAELVRTFYEGSATSNVPWSAWLPSLLGWGVFLLVLWLTLYATISLFRERWIAHERLRFPIVDFSLSLTGGGAIPSFKDPILWIGISLSVAYNATNILHTLYPNLPALGRALDLAPFFPDPPLKALAPMLLSYRPEIFGLGYLVNTDVLFTVWSSYLALRFLGVGLTASGYDLVTTAYDYQEIAAGAYLGMLVVLIWQARTHLKSILRRPEGIRYAAMIVGGLAYLGWWCNRVGLVWWLAAAYLLLIVAFAVVYARMRAETGAPLMALFPFWQQQKLLVNLLGTPVLSATGFSSLSAFVALGFLARGTFPELASYQAEAMEIGHRTRMRSRCIAVCLTTALIFGLVFGMYLYLTYAYRQGFAMMDAGTGQGGYRVRVAIQQYRMLEEWRTHYVPPNIGLLAQTGAGFASVLGIVWLRGVLLGCPLHPIGLAMSTSYGVHLWFPFLMVWACKLLILRLGGAAGYRRLVPLFLGIVLGHYFTAGVIWGGLSLVSPEAARAYVVHFS